MKKLIFFLLIVATINSAIANGGGGIIWNSRNSADVVRVVNKTGSVIAVNIGTSSTNSSTITVQCGGSTYSNIRAFACITSGDVTWQSSTNQPANGTYFVNLCGGFFADKLNLEKSLINTLVVKKLN